MNGSNNVTSAEVVVEKVVKRGINNTIVVRISKNINTGIVRGVIQFFEGAKIVYQTTLMDKELTELATALTESLKEVETLVNKIKTT